MDPVLSQKMQTIQESKNGRKTLDVLHMSAYFAPESIRNRVFSSIFSDPPDLEDALKFLQRLSLIESTDESSFSMPCEIRSKLREHLCKVGTEEDVLKRVVFLSNASKRMEYPHLQSVYISSKRYPSLIDEVGKLPGKIVFGMLRAGKFLEAYEFGTVCYEFLYRALNEFHSVVIDMKMFLALALLSIMKRKEEAITTLSEMYDKWCKMKGEESYGALVKLVIDVFENELFDASASEARLRMIIFHGKKVSDTTEGLDFEKWLLYCDVLFNFGLIKKSIGILDQVIIRRKVLFGQDDVGILNAMHIKGRCLIEQRKLPEAVELLVDIFAKRIEKSGPMNLKTLSIQIDVGRILKFNKEYHTSLMVFQETVKRLKQIVGETHDLYLIALTNIVEIYKLKYDFEKALELSSNLTDKLKSRFGVFHPKFIEYKISLGEMLLEMGRPEAARKIFLELLEIAKKSLAPEHEILKYNMIIFLTQNTDCTDAPTTLHLAAKEDDLEKLLYLVDSGENIDVRDGTGRTPLHYASLFGKVRIARLLIEKGASFNAEELHSSTPLHLAKGSEMKTLLKSFNLFFESVKADNIERVSGFAVKDSIYIKARDVNGCTSLHWAALHGHVKVLRVLLELGSDPLVVSKKLNSPLHIAASKGHVGIAEALLHTVGPNKATTMLNCKTIKRNTPLHAASERGFVAMARTLLAHGAVYNAKNAAGKTPLMLSKDEGCKNLLEFVEGMFLDTSKGDVESVRAKLRDLEEEDIPAVMRARNEKNRTLLREAREMKHIELAKELVMFLIKDL